MSAEVDDRDERGERLGDDDAREDRDEGREQGGQRDERQEESADALAMPTSASGRAAAVLRSMPLGPRRLDVRVEEAVADLELVGREPPGGEPLQADREHRLTRMSERDEHEDPDVRLGLDRADDAGVSSVTLWSPFR